MLLNQPLPCCCWCCCCWCRGVVVLEWATRSTLLPCLAPVAVTLAIDVAKERDVAKEEERRVCDAANAQTSKTQSAAIAPRGRPARPVARRRRARRGHTPPRCAHSAAVAATAATRNLLPPSSATRVDIPVQESNVPLPGSVLVKKSKRGLARQCNAVGRGPF